MTSFGLKIIALFSMLCDHAGDIFLRSPSIFNIIGRLAFPIFAFQISEGYKHTRNLKKYVTRLFIFAIISQIPFMLFRKSLNVNMLNLNVFFTLLLGLFSITIYNRYHTHLLGLIPVILLAFLAQIIKCDYGWYGVTIIFLFYLFKDNKILMTESVLVTIILKYVIAYIYTPHIYQLYLMLGSISSLFIINLYNNKKGKNIKYLLYVFYPIHLFLLALIKIYILN